MGYEYYNYPFLDDDYYQYGQVVQRSYGLSALALSLLSIIFLYIVIAWIFRSIGLYHMAKNRGINHAWFAWIPILSFYIVGRLINNKVVLGDNIVTKHAEFFLPLFSLMATTVSFTGMWGATISLAIWVYTLSAYWRLFKIYRPKNRVSFTIWSAIIGSGFFIFAIRDDKPFDPLEPNKVYQNYYANKHNIEERYEEAKETLVENEKKASAVLDDELQEELSKATSEDQKEQIRATIDKEKKELLELTEEALHKERIIRDRLESDLEKRVEAAANTFEPEVKSQEPVVEVNIETAPLDEPVIVTAPLDDEISNIILSISDEDLVLPEDLINNTEDDE